MPRGEDATAEELSFASKCGKNTLHSIGNKGLAGAKNASLDYPPYPAVSGPRNGPWRKRRRKRLGDGDGDKIRNGRAYCWRSVLCREALQPFRDCRALGFER